jgi:hypothetical protein
VRDLLELLGALSILVVLVALVPFLLGLAIPYAILRLRPGQERDVDPQVGMKAVLHYAFSLSLLMIIGGISYLVVDALSDQQMGILPAQPPQFNPRGFPPAAPVHDREFTRPQRIAVALIVSGFALGALHLVLLLGFTNDRARPETRRVFVGCRLAVHSFVLLYFFTALVVELFDEAKWETIKVFLGVLIVWGPSWAIHLLLLRLYRFANYRPRPVRLSMDETTDE